MCQWTATFYIYCAILCAASDKSLSENCWENTFKFFSISAKWDSENELNEKRTKKNMKTLLQCTYATFVFDIILYFIANNKLPCCCGMFERRG